MKAQTRNSGLLSEVLREKRKDSRVNAEGLRVRGYQKGDDRVTISYNRSLSVSLVTVLIVMR